MTPEHEALARRAVACPRWRWMPGMLRLRYAPGMADHGKREGRVEAREDWSYAPDVADPATLGCLLALVREAWRLCRTTMNATPEQFQAVAPQCAVMIQTHIDQLETAVDRAISAAMDVEGEG